MSYGGRVAIGSPKRRVSMKFRSGLPFSRRARSKRVSPFVRGGRNGRLTSIGSELSENRVERLGKTNDRKGVRRITVPVGVSIARVGQVMAAMMPADVVLALNPALVLATLVGLLALATVAATPAGQARRPMTRTNAERLTWERVRNLLHSLLILGGMLVRARSQVRCLTQSACCGGCTSAPS